VKPRRSRRGTAAAAGNALPNVDLARGSRAVSGADCQIGDLPQLLTMQQVAELLQCSVRTVRAYVASGRLPSCRPVPKGSGRRYVARGHVLELLGLAPARSAA
jgi:excisionase family DNA binding protein